MISRADVCVYRETPLLNWRTGKTRKHVNNNSDWMCDLCGTKCNFHSSDAGPCATPENGEFDFWRHAAVPRRMDAWCEVNSMNRQRVCTAIITMITNDAMTNCMSRRAMYAPCQKHDSHATTMCMVHAMQALRYDTAIIIIMMRSELDRLNGPVCGPTIGIIYIYWAQIGDMIQLTTRFALAKLSDAWHSALHRVVDDW